MRQTVLIREDISHEPTGQVKRQCARPGAIEEFLPRGSAGRFLLAVSFAVAVPVRTMFPDRGREKLVQETLVVHLPLRIAGEGCDRLDVRQCETKSLPEIVQERPDM